MKFILSFTLIVFVSHSSIAQLGSSAESYKKMYPLLDNSLPSPTGENWHIFSTGNGQLAVLFDKKKSVVERYFFKNKISLDKCKEYLTKAEPGEWLTKSGNSYVFSSPSGKYHSNYSYEYVNIAIRKDMFWCFGMDKFDHFQNKNVIDKKPRFPRTSRNSKTGLGMTYKSIVKAFGKPISDKSFESSKMCQIKNNGKIRDYRFDHKGECYAVSFQSSEIYTAKTLEKVTSIIDRSWKYYGAFGLSKSKKYIVKVELHKVTIFDAYRLQKMNKYRIPSLKLPY